MKISTTVFDKFNNFIVQLNDQNERHSFQNEVLIAISDLIPYDYASFYDSSLNVQGGKLTLDSLAAINLDKEFIAEYNNYYYKLDPSLPFISNPSFYAYRTADINKSSRFFNSGYYNDYLKPYGISYEMCINLAFNQNYLGAITLLRSATLNDFSDMECYIFQKLQPNISKYMARINCFSGGESFTKISFDHAVLNAMKIYNLSLRETEVLKLILQGYNNNDICDILYIELNTVKTHIRHIFNKMSISSRTQAVSTVLSLI